MVIAISMARDEADVIEETVGHMLTQVDRVIVADNGSTDGTRDILERLGVDVVDDPDPAYFQSRKMTGLARAAARLGAEWIIPFDSDEVWYSPFGRIADVLDEFPAASVATAALYDHVATALDPAGPPVSVMGWRRREAAPLPKVACRPVMPVTIHQGNHGADYGQTVENLLVVRHYPYRSAEQMIRKARNGAGAYAATDLPEDVGKHWRDYGRLSDEQIADTFRRWFWIPAPEADSSLIYDPAPCASLSLSPG